MMRMTIAVGLAALLAGCGGSPSTTSATTTASSSSENGSAGASVGSVAAVTGGVEGSNDCSKKPDFAPVYAGGTIRVCSSAHFDAANRTSGTVSYTTAAAPAAVLAWSKEQAAKAGLAERLSTDKMFSAGEGARRTLMVMALPDGSGSRVTVNWGKAD
jgi:hypothetical protein